MKKTLPAWLVVIVIIETLPMFAGPYVALFSPTGMGSLTGGESFTFGAMLYSARNLAVGIALLVALLLRNYAMLFILILVRLITDLVDYPTLMLLGDVENVGRVTSIFVFLYYIPAVVALRYLWRELKDGGPVGASSQV